MRNIIESYGYKRLFVVRDHVSEGEKRREKLIAEE